ncbi:MAG TPA: sugar-binding protein, partial [Tepidisphaeraceae bacterium]|nr:sugar-binding protein [Tepidisphaeraceae bacterium]
AAADPNQFPDQLKKDGLFVWQVRKLYFTGGGPHATQIDLNQTLPNGRTPGDVAAEAASHHRSQAFGSYTPRRGPARPQSFILAKSVVPFVGGETDLLRGLPIPDDKPHRVMPPAQWQGGSEPIEFVPRPAIAQYQAWTRTQGIEHVATRMAADVPVVAGRSNEVHLIVHNRDASPLQGTIAFEAPQGWKLDPQSLQYTVPSNSDEPLTVNVTPPPMALVDSSLTASTQSGGKIFTASAKAHPVPFMEVPALSAAPSLDGTETGWSGLPIHEIPPTNLVQGHVKDAADSSAHFRVAHDDKFLYFDVDVNDDVVVSNIAPDDIRGHWRSDSIEICLDPAGGAENTLGCFKVGIFPFDTTGHVRAARDADANQGPIEETAPNMRLSSRRTPTGYRIQAAIPFDEIGIAPTSWKIMGFNLIIYDGDKADAAIGENINKSRIAWSPRPGVQGRPEDWGRIELK